MATATKKQPETKPAAPAAPKSLRVRVKEGRIGYYGLRRRREGSVFTLRDAKHFSESWMEWVAPGTALTSPKADGAQAALNKQSDAIRNGDDDGPEPEPDQEEI